MTTLNRILLMVLMAGAAIGVFLVKKRSAVDARPIIVIIQTASHVALDAARDGFVQTIEKAFVGKYNFVVKNAEGSVMNALTIAQSVAVKPHVTAFFAIGTMAAQAIAKVEKKRPVFFTAVTYPDQAGIVQSNVAGVSDAFDLTALVNFTHRTVPAAKKVGILFNSGSEIAQQERDVLREACAKLGLESIAIGGITEAELITSLKSGVRKIDVCIAPTDNAVASAVRALADVCIHAKVPFVVADKTLVSSGPFAGLGMDYTELGKQTALMAIDLFDGKKTVKECGITYAVPAEAFNEHTRAAISQ